MRGVRWIAALLAVIPVVFVGAPAHAAGADTALLPASARLAGLTGGELIGDEIRILLELPKAKNPIYGKGDSCFSAGPEQQVLIAWTRPTAPTCTVRPGTPVFLSTYWVECSAVEAPPFFGATAAEQRECALHNLATLSTYSAMLVSVDGGKATNVYRPKYLAVSPQMTAKLPHHNVLGVTAPATTFVAAGWVGMIRHRLLPPGTHTIRVELVHADGTPSDISKVIVKVKPASP